MLSANRRLSVSRCFLRTDAFPSGYDMSFGSYDINYFIHIFLAQLVAARLHHDADHGLCAGFTYQDSSFLAEFIGHFLNGRLDIGIILRIRFALHADILQYLRIEFHRCRQLAHGCPSPALLPSF